MKTKLITTLQYIIDLTAIPAVCIGYLIELQKEGLSYGKAMYNRNKD